MASIKRGQLEENISSATVLFLNTGRSEILKTRKNSACHFFEPFQIEDDTIQLRLDWTDLDENGNPTLDADFYNSKTNKKRSLKGLRSDSHHTSSNKSEGRSYLWEFKDFSHPFRVQISWLASVSEKVTASCSASAVIIRAGKEIA